MIPTAQAKTVRVVSTRMPTRWGDFQALGFEREIANGAEKGVRHLLCEAPFGPFRQKVPDPFFAAGTRRVETALALVLGDLTEGAPLVRIHSQCFTGEVLGSLRCDCNDQWPGDGHRLGPCAIPPGVGVRTIAVGG